MTIDKSNRSANAGFAEYVGILLARGRRTARRAPCALLLLSLGVPALCGPLQAPAKITLWESSLTAAPGVLAALNPSFSLLTTANAAIVLSRSGLDPARLPALPAAEAAEAVQTAISGQAREGLRRAEQDLAAHGPASGNFERSLSYLGTLNAASSLLPADEKASFETQYRALDARWDGTSLAKRSPVSAAADMVSRAGSRLTTQSLGTFLDKNMTALRGAKMDHRYNDDYHRVDLHVTLPDLAGSRRVQIPRALEAPNGNRMRVHIGVAPEAVEAELDRQIADLRLRHGLSSDVTTEYSYNGAHARWARSGKRTRSSHMTRARLPRRLASSGKPAMIVYENITLEAREAEIRTFLANVRSRYALSDSIPMDYHGWSAYHRLRTLAIAFPNQAGLARAGVPKILTLPDGSRVQVFARIAGA
jgi:hypothetical protein